MSSELCLFGPLHLETGRNIRKRSEVEPEASPSAGLISSLPDQPSSKKPKLEEHSIQASSAVASSTSVVLNNRIKLVKDSIESRQFIKALKHINVLQSKFPPSALVLALKALVYEKIASKDEVLSVCSDAKEHMFSDISCLPDVLATLDTVCQRLDRLDMALGYYEHACGKDCDSLELMRGLFNCYARQSSFAKQLEVSLKMYKLVREDKFLFWPVFCIQLQVLWHLLNKYGMDHFSDEPEAFLVYMSITELQEMDKPVREILYKLGPTLLVVKADKHHLEEGKLLAHVCDYAAAVELLKKILESCSPGDWESLINDFSHSLGDDSKWCGGATENKIQPPVFLACKLSQLPNEKCGSKILEALKLSNLENGWNRCHPDRKGNDLFEEAIYEYFTRIDLTAQRFFRILSKDEEYWLIDNLLKLIDKLLKQDGLTKELLKEEFSKICTISKIPKHFETLCEGFKSAIHGATIVLKTNKFIILAADGELTSAYSDNALFLKSEKIRQFDDLCFAISGVWNTLSKTVGILNKYMRHLKKTGEGRPTVRKVAGHIAKEGRMLKGAFDVIICAFDELEVGQPPVACVSSPGSWNKGKSFYCSGRYSGHAEYILSEADVRADMGLAEAICWVERALVYTAMFDSCTGGLANITVIGHDKKVRVMAREYIHTTLWERHRHFFENRKT